MDTLNIPSKGGGGRREDWWAPYLFVGWILYSDILNVHDLYMEKVCFWPFNYHPSSILAIKLQNRVFLTIKLFKTVYIWPSGWFGDSFADVNPTWWWDPPISPPLSPLSSFFSPHPLFSPIQLLWPCVGRRLGTGPCCIKGIQMNTIISSKTF